MSVKRYGFEPFETTEKGIINIENKIGYSIFLFTLLDQEHMQELIIMLVPLHLHQEHQ